MRRRTLIASGLAGTALLSTTSPASAGAAVLDRERTTPTTPRSPESSIRELARGNLRWAKNRQVHPHEDQARRVQVASGQQPIATVFSCIDSRVPPELFFDQGLGDLMTVRTAAHAEAGLERGCLQFSVLELGIPLIVVLGHQRCGAVTAAVAYFEGGERPPGHILDIVETIRPAYNTVKKTNPPATELVDAVIRQNTISRAFAVTDDELLAGYVAQGSLRVVPAYFALDTSRVSLL